MDSVISTIKDSKSYDLIIFDSPPIVGLSDASLISKYSDGLILL